MGQVVGAIFYIDPFSMSEAEILTSLILKCSTTMDLLMLATHIAIVKGPSEHQCKLSRKILLTTYWAGQVLFTRTLTSPNSTAMALKALQITPTLAFIIFLESQSYISVLA